MDKRWENPLYVTTTINDEGLEGHAYVPDGIKIQVSNPLNDHPGTNPEQLLGLSLATCLKATLQAVENEHHVPQSAQVHVNVAFVGQRAVFEFLVHVQIRIPAVDFATATAFVKEAEGRCPVSKLLSGNATYTIETVTEFHSI